MNPNGDDGDGNYPFGDISGIGSSESPSTTSHASPSLSSSHSSPATAVLSSVTATSAANSATAGARYLFARASNISSSTPSAKVPWADAPNDPYNDGNDWAGDGYWSDDFSPAMRWTAVGVLLAVIILAWLPWLYITIRVGDLYQRLEKCRADAWVHSISDRLRSFSNPGMRPTRSLGTKNRFHGP